MKERMRVLIIEDNERLAADAKREIEDAFEESERIEVEITATTDFDEGFEKVRRGESDIVVLDVRRDGLGASPEDEVAGRNVYERIKEARFAPVIFWTALPETVALEEMGPLVSVVPKEATDKLPEAIRAAVDSRAIQTVRDIEAQVAAVLRQHMWNELAPNWLEYIDGNESSHTAQVLLNRLSRVLEGQRDKVFTGHPSHRYVYPPTLEFRTPGDLLRGESEDWWVILTPSCDFAQSKVEYILLARADPLERNSKYKAWIESMTPTSSSKDKWNNLKKNVLVATNGRFHYLPAFREIPDLVIDLENVRSISVGELDDNFKLVASLVSPFAEALLTQYSHYRGRVGVPDLDAELIKQRLTISHSLRESSDYPGD